MSRLRVLEVVASSRGGGAVHVRDLATNLDPERFRVTVAMPEDGGHVGRADFTSHGVAFEALPIASGFRLGALLALRRLAMQADILHLHGARAALFGRLAAASLSKHRPRVLYTIHGFAAPHYGRFRRTLLLGLERLLSRWTDTVIAVSASEREVFLTATGYPPGTVRIVWNGISLAPFQSLTGRKVLRQTSGLPQGMALVITVCRLYKPRDFTTLLRAFQGLSHRMDVHLLIVGDGPYRPEVEALIKALGLEKRVTLLGFRRDVPALLGASDLFVLSTDLWEGLPLTILEAMAAGRPVVASRIGGIVEAVSEGETGLLVPPKDPVALEEAMYSLLSNPAKAAAMGQAGRERVARHFTLERMVQEIAVIYEEEMPCRHF